jgi:hypothetical protein
MIYFYCDCKGRPPFLRLWLICTGADESAVCTIHRLLWVGNPPDHARDQGNPGWHIIQLDILSGIVGKATACDRAIERGNAHRGNGIGIGCAATADILDI